MQVNNTVVGLNSSNPANSTKLSYMRLTLATMFETYVKMNKIKSQMITPNFSVEEGVFFELFTQNNPTEADILQLNNYSSIQQSNFDAKKPTRMFIHGWNSDGSLPPLFSQAYFINGSHNVNFIAVNWQKGSTTVNYINARRRVAAVAEYVAKFVDFMVDMAMINIGDLTIIGHSLGAHIAGISECHR